MLAEEHYDHDAGYLGRQLALVDGIRDAAKEGRISASRLDEAVGRVLKVKRLVDPARRLDVLETSLRTSAQALRDPLPDDLDRAL